MVVIKLVFKIVDTFGLMDRDEQETYLDQAQKEWKETPLFDVDDKEIDYSGFKAVLAKIKKLEQNWLFAVCVSISSIFLIRGISEYLTPDNPIDQFRQDIR